MLRQPTKFAQHRGHKIITEPDGEPVTLPEIKSFIEYGEIDKDDLLTLLIKTARQTFEEYTGRALITQQWQMTLDGWPGTAEPWWDGVQQGAISELRGRPGWVVLPRYRLQSVDAVRVFDDGGNSQSVAIGDIFLTDTEREPGRLVLKNSATWPIALQRANAIEIDYTAGYGNAASVPAAIKHAIMTMAAYLFEHRGACDADDAFVKSGAMATAQRFKVRKL